MNFNNRINRIEKALSDIIEERCPVCLSGWRHRMVVMRNGSIDPTGDTWRDAEEWHDANGNCMRCGKAVSTMMLAYSDSPCGPAKLTLDWKGNPAA